ncbi:hypothetical protein CTA2_131, partial [Colletotrichum tanaceti]
MALIAQLMTSDDDDDGIANDLRQLVGSTNGL